MSPDKYTFREAVASDFPGIAKLFERRTLERGWAAWKYLANPDGVARVFLVEDSGKSIVGTLAYVPRRFTSANTGTLVVMQVVDVFLTTELRKQGVFLGLLEFARRRVDGPRIGVPNDSSMLFGPGLGWQVLGPYETWVFPVLIGELPIGRRLAAFVAPFGNALSRVYTSCWLPSSRRHLTMKRVTRFVKDYTLDPAVIHGVRSADYLNWRFVDNPVGQYCTYEFFDRNDPVGYCVFTQVGSHAVIADFLATRCARGCLRLLIDHCRARAIACIRWTGTGLKLRKLGFIRREKDRTCMAYQPPEGRWIVTPCDIDAEPGRTAAGAGDLRVEESC